ncbi:thiamine pyrophosphate-dependent enzyme [Streptomyces sp. NPDC059896]|uniref:thiamine pyrophosphate-dependent enzyme n=1 Tax=Streptomyces sp. NPDC059896 TaxID=3346993 RepID=UPI00365AD8C0
MAASQKLSQSPFRSTRPIAEADTSGPHFTAEAILDAIDRGTRDDDTVFSLEWTSAEMLRDRLTIARARSLFYSAAGGLGWGLPAAIGLKLGRPDRPVVCLLGDGSPHYSVAGLWTAARHEVPVTFVVCTNTKYRALEESAEELHVPKGEYLHIPDLGIPDIARGYGLEVHRAETLEDLTEYLKKGPDATGPRLVEILQR